MPENFQHRKSKTPPTHPLVTFSSPLIGRNKIGNHQICNYCSSDRELPFLDVELLLLGCGYFDFFLDVVIVQVILVAPSLYPYQFQQLLLSTLLIHTIVIKSEDFWDINIARRTSGVKGYLSDLSLLTCHLVLVALGLPFSTCHSQLVTPDLSLPTCHSRHVTPDVSLPTCHS